MNTWNIKINEQTSPIKGFVVSVERNGEYVGGVRGVIQNFEKAVNEGKNIVLSHVKFRDIRDKRASLVNESFIKRFIRSGNFVGIYNSIVKKDDKGSPYLEVTMDVSNNRLVKLVPEYVTDPKTKIDYKIVKVGRLSSNQSINV